jgi:protein TonB
MLLAIAACATTPPAPQVLPHDPAPEAKLDPKTCPMIVLNGPLPVQYPVKAFEIGQEGWTHLRFDIDEKGEAANVVLLGSSPPGVFDDAARATMVNARFISANSKGCEFVLEYKKDPPK